MAESAIKRDKDRDGELGEGTVAFSLTKPVDLGQLDLELQEAMGLDEPMGISSSGVMRQASEKNPVTVWFHGEVDAAKVRSVVSKHTYSQSELDKLMSKAQAGEDLDDGELQAAVRSLLLRVR